LKKNEKTLTKSIATLSPLFLDILNSGSRVKLTITGNSMYPLLRTSIDSVIIKKKSTISKYDIILYKRENGEYILHRVVGIKEDGAMVLAGDFETVTEYPVYPKQVIATVESIFRKGKHISCNNPLYKIYSFLWVLFMPNRFIIVKILKGLRSALSGQRWKSL